MLTQYSFKSEITNANHDGDIFVAGNGRGFTLGEEMHIEANHHLVYNFSSGMWSMIHPVNGTSHCLGEGASPSVLVRDIEFINKEYFDEIIVASEDEYKSRKRKDDE